MRNLPPHSSSRRFYSHSGRRHMGQSRPAFDQPLTERRRIRTILVPLDFSERSRRLLEMASSFADQTEAELVLFHVNEQDEYAPAHCTPERFKEWKSRLRQEAGEMLQNLKAEWPLHPRIQRARVEAAVGFLETEIPAIIKSTGADLIFVSTHGYHGIKRLFLGSKAENILRSAGCPVLAIPDSFLPQGK